MTASHRQHLSDTPPTTITIYTIMTRKTSLITIVAILLAASAWVIVQNTGREPKAIASIADIKGCIIGVQLGTTGDVKASALEKEGHNEVERYTKAADAVQALTQGKIDCVVVDEQPAYAFCRQTNGIRVLAEPLSTEYLAMCLAKPDSIMARMVNNAIRTLKQKGIIGTIIDRHIKGEASTAYAPKRGGRAAGVLTVATNATFKPYEYYDHGNIVGIDIDIAHAIADELNMDIKVEDMEFDAIIAAIQNGKARIGAAGMTVTPERKGSVLFTEPYATSRKMVIVRDNNGSATAGHGIISRFKNNFIADGRYTYLLKGLGNTLIITVCAMLISLLLGTLIAVIRTTHDNNGSMPIANILCKTYLMIIRGTPTMVQLLIIYYVVFAAVDISKVLVAVVAFGLNSAAYLAEVIRSGIMAVDKGQMEAGRSLGLSYATTMRRIVMPQAFKNVLPAIGNELITLLKETSISGYIGLTDLTKGSDIIRSITYDAMMPLGLVAAIYFMLVMALSTGISRIEKRMRKNEYR